MKTLVFGNLFTLLDLLSHSHGQLVVGDNRDFKIRSRGRQRERKKYNSFNKQNNNFARASHFFVHFFPVSLFLHDYEVKIPKFAFYGGRKQAKTKFYFSL